MRQCSAGGAAFTQGSCKGTASDVLHSSGVDNHEVKISTIKGQEAISGIVLQEEQQSVEAAVAAVGQVVGVLWGQARTVLFGSQATGLALPGSDLDIVVLGVSEDMASAAGGFTRCAHRLGPHVCAQEVHHAIA